MADEPRTDIETLEGNVSRAWRDLCDAQAEYEHAKEELAQAKERIHHGE